MRASFAGLIFLFIAIGIALAAAYMADLDLATHKRDSADRLEVSIREERDIQSKMLRQLLCGSPNTIRNGTEAIRVKFKDDAMSMRDRELGCEIENGIGWIRVALNKSKGK